MPDNEIIEAPQPAPQPPAPPADDATAIFALIERAARDPSVDIEKFKALFALRREAEAERARLQFVEAFAALQSELPIIDQKGRIVVYSKQDRDKPGGPTPEDRPIQATPYTKFDDILEAIRGPLSAHGFGIRFETTSAEGRLVVTCFLEHKGGHWKKADSFPLKHDTTGSKNDTQAAGSAMSYGMRYALRQVVPIVSHAPEDKDDDGRAAGGGTTAIDADQAAYVEQLVRDTGSDRALFLKAMDAPALADPAEDDAFRAAIAALNVEQYKRAVALLNEKKRRARGAA